MVVVLVVVVVVVWTNVVGGLWYTGVKDTLPQTSVNSTAVSQSCTTTTTTTSTTTTTTTLAITFNLAITACTGLTATVTASNFANSISGLYEINTTTYGTLNDSLNGAFEDTVGNSKTYLLVPQGTRYVAVRDKNNVSNISYNTVTNNCTTSTTTTTTTLPPLVVTNSAVTCSGNLGEFTSTFTGGTGTYTTASIVVVVVVVDVVQLLTALLYVTLVLSVASLKPINLVP